MRKILFITIVLIFLADFYSAGINHNSTFAVEINPNYNTRESSCMYTCDRMITWSGFTWCVMGTNETICGPGPNYFSSSTDNVWIDSVGDLHLRITKRSGRYYCAVLFTVQTVGYGTYTFYVSSRLDSLDKNVVAGLFTWNDKNCETNANSELDIEFTRWGDASDPDVIEYSVQPTNGGLAPERDARRPMVLNSKNSIHFINWAPSIVTMSAYQGHANPPLAGSLITTWSFDSNHVPRSKLECDSDPIIIPSPENATHLDLNLWLNGGIAPSNNQESEVIIHRVEFNPVTLLLKVIPEGFYNSVSHLLKRKDTVSVYLRNATSPFAITDSAKSIIDTVTYSGLFGFRHEHPTACYLVVKHLNTLETWSKSGGELLKTGLNNSYDFTIDSIKAFGKNIKRIDNSPVRFGIYSGDVNKDGLINLNDLIVTYNDASNFLTGRIRSDVNGDNITSLHDLLVIYNNSVEFVMKIIP